MHRSTWRTALVATALVVASCGGSDDGKASPSDAEAAATESVEATDGADTTTTEEPTTTEEATTTEATTTTQAETTTTAQAAPAIPDPPPAGTGILTVDGVEFPFTIEVCNLDPAPAPVGDSILVFEVRGSTTAEGQSAEARLLRIAPLGGSPGNDSFGWGYATDPNDFESLVSVGSPFGIGEHIIVERTDAGLTFYGPPTPFERTEGISVVEDVDPGLGSIIATC